MLADLERRSTDVAERERAVAHAEGIAAARTQQADRLRGDLDAREADLREREVALEREGREQARRFLLEARKRVEEALRLAKETAAADAAEAAATAREARRIVEQGVVEQGSELERLTKWAGKADGTVRAVRGEGAGRAEGAASSPSRLVGTSGTDIAPRTGVSEVDLRGMMADEAREAVERAVDDAVLADLPVLRIIHGKGTGVLRKVVDEVLRADRRVTGHQLAPPREGGTGVTVAELG
jgi:DNA mismatch repair protein MutS2